MLPCAQHRPPRSSQAQGLICVSPSILFDFPLPVVAVCHRRRPVLGATVPPTAVDVDRDSLPGEYDVRPKSSTTLGLDREIDAKPQAARMKNGTHSSLGPRVRTAVRPHDASAEFGNTLPCLSRAAGHDRYVRARGVTMRTAPSAILIA
jgi:hypothetical protein